MIDYDKPTWIKRPPEREYSLYFSQFDQAWTFISNSIGIWEVLREGTEESFYLKGYGVPKKTVLDRRITGTHPYPNNEPKTEVFYKLEKVTVHKVPDFLMNPKKRY